MKGQLSSPHTTSVPRGLQGRGAIKRTIIDVLYIYNYDKNELPLLNMYNKHLAKKIIRCWFALPNQYLIKTGFE